MRRRKRICKEKCSWKSKRKSEQRTYQVKPRLLSHTSQCQVQYRANQLLHSTSKINFFHLVCLEVTRSLPVKSPFHQDPGIWVVTMNQAPILVVTLIVSKASIKGRLVKYYLLSVKSWTTLPVLRTCPFANWTGQWKTSIVFTGQTSCSFLISNLKMIQWASSRGQLPWGKRTKTNWHLMITSMTGLSSH